MTQYNLRTVDGVTHNTILQKPLDYSNKTLNNIIVMNCVALVYL